MIVGERILEVTGTRTPKSSIKGLNINISIENVEVSHGDTNKIPFGMGTYGSRSLAVGGSAIVKAMDKIVAKAKRIAAHLMEASVADVEFKNGNFTVAGTDKSIPWGTVALTAYVVIRTDYTALRDKPVTGGNGTPCRPDWMHWERTSSGRVPGPPVGTTRGGDRIVALQRRLDEGRSDGRLPEPEGRDLQARLDTIRGDYSRMTDGGRTMSYEERDRVQGRLVALDADVTRALAPTTRRDDPRNGDRNVALQRRIDDGRNSGCLPQTEGRELQARLDGIRSDSSRMTDGGRAATYAERTDISRRLDSVERDLDR